MRLRTLYCFFLTNEALGYVFSEFCFLHVCISFVSTLHYSWLPWLPENMLHFLLALLLTHAHVEVKTIPFKTLFPCVCNPFPLLCGRYENEWVTGFTVQHRLHPENRLIFDTKTCWDTMLHLIIVPK